jgi:hypothetical protein
MKKPFGRQWLETLNHEPKALSLQFVAERMRIQLLRVVVPAKRKRKTEEEKWKSRLWSLRHEYGQGAETWFENKVTECNGLCEICHEKMTPINVDHDHSLSGVQSLRGLLCTSCNNGLGCFEDNKTKLTNAIAYLERFRVSINQTTTQS